MDISATQPGDLHDQVVRKFGDRVRALRERSGSTLEQLSQRSGVSRAYKAVGKFRSASRAAVVPCSSEALSCPPLVSREV